MFREMKNEVSEKLTASSEIQNNLEITTHMSEKFESLNLEMENLRSDIKMLEKRLDILEKQHVQTKHSIF